jgi:hypothetical protein
MVAAFLGSSALPNCGGVVVEYEHGNALPCPAHPRCEDPTTRVHYHLIQYEPAAAVDDDYIREMLAEAQADIDRGDVAKWDAEEIKREGRKLLAKKQAGR